MNEEFKKAFDSLSYAYKKIIAQVIRMMEIPDIDDIDIEENNKSKSHS